MYMNLLSVTYFKLLLKLNVGAYTPQNFVLKHMILFK